MMPVRPPIHRPAGGQRANAAATQQYDQRRGGSTQRGYNSRWQRYRENYLREHPLCIECEAAGELTPATVVDHVEPHKGDHKLFWDPKNHQPMCKPHHDRKTATEDGGFGNRRRS